MYVNAALHLVAISDKNQIKVIFFFLFNKKGLIVAFGPRKENQNVSYICKELHGNYNLFRSTNWQQNDINPILKPVQSSAHPPPLLGCQWGFNGQTISIHGGQNALNSNILRRGHMRCKSAIQLQISNW